MHCCGAAGIDGRARMVMWHLDCLSTLAWPDLQAEPAASWNSSCHSGLKRSFATLPARGQHLAEGGVWQLGEPLLGNGVPRSQLLCGRWSQHWAEDVFCFGVWMWCKRFHTWIGIYLYCAIAVSLNCWASSCRLVGVWLSVRIYASRCASILRSSTSASWLGLWAYTLWTLRSNLMLVSLNASYRGGLCRRLACFWCRWGVCLAFHWQSSIHILVCMLSFMP